jgi:hypothetical protein
MRGTGILEVSDTDASFLEMDFIIVSDTFPITRNQWHFLC